MLRTDQNYLNLYLQLQRWLLFIFDYIYIYRGAATDHTQPADRGPLSPTLTGIVMNYNCVECSVLQYVTIFTYQECGSKSGYRIKNYRKKIERKFKFVVGILILF